MDEFIKLTRIVETIHCEEKESVPGVQEEVLYIRKSKIGCILPSGNNTKIYIENMVILVKEDIETIKYLLNGYKRVYKEEFSCGGNCKDCFDFPRCLGKRVVKTVWSWEKI